MLLRFQLTRLEREGAVWRDGKQKFTSPRVILRIHRKSYGEKMSSDRTSITCLLLLAAIFLNVGGCSTAGNLPINGAYGSGYGSFSLALATNTNYALKYYRDDTDYTLLEVESVDHPGSTYDIDLAWYPVMGVRQAYGYLPAGRYRLSQLSVWLPTSYAYGGSNTTGYIKFNGTVPSFQVDPDEHTDLGMLVIETNPASLDHAFVGWMPSDHDATAVMRARINQHSPVPAIRQASLARSDGADALVVAHAFENPAPSGQIRAYHTGEIVIPGHLGSILYRDPQEHWHVLATGHTAYVRDAGILDDGRIAAMNSNGRILLSDVAHKHWQELHLSVPLETLDQLGVLSGGHIAVGGRMHWYESAQNGKPEKREGLAIYMTDAQLGKCRLVERLANADRIAFDYENAYLYESTNAGKVLRSDELLVTNVLSGKTESRTVPAEILSSFGNGLMTAYDDSNDPALGGISDLPQFVSRDAGRTWRRIKSHNDATGELHLNGAMFPLGSADSAISRGRYHDLAADTDSFGYFETEDGGTTWRPAFNTTRGCVFTAQVTLVDGVIWTACDEGTVWKMDSATGAVTQERAVDETIPP